MEHFKLSSGVACYKCTHGIKCERKGHINAKKTKLAKERTLVKHPKSCEPNDVHQ